MPKSKSKAQVDSVCLPTHAVIAQAAGSEQGSVHLLIRRILTQIHLLSATCPTSQHLLIHPQTDPGSRPSRDVAQAQDSGVCRRLAAPALHRRVGDNAYQSGAFGVEHKLQVSRSRSRSSTAVVGVIAPTRRGYQRLYLLDRKDT